MPCHTGKPRDEGPAQGVHFEVQRARGARRGDALERDCPFRAPNRVGPGYAPVKIPVFFSGQSIAAILYAPTNVGFFSGQPIAPIVYAPINAGPFQGNQLLDIFVFGP